MKRYAIVEIPETVMSNKKEHWSYGTLFKIIDGPVELMEAACKEAGMVWRLPKKGDPYFSPEGRRQARIDFAAMSAGGGHLQACIPAPEPEPEKESWMVWVETDIDPGGIGGGGTGGPL
jgi:hypothetical protein